MYYAVYRYDVLVYENGYREKQRYSFSVEEKGKARKFAEDVNNYRWPSCYNSAELVPVFDHWQSYEELQEVIAARYEHLTGKPYPKQ